MHPPGRLARHLHRAPEVGQVEALRRPVQPADGLDASFDLEILIAVRVHEALQVLVVLVTDDLTGGSHIYPHLFQSRYHRLGQCMEVYKQGMLVDFAAIHDEVFGVLPTPF